MNAVQMSRLILKSAMNASEKCMLLKATGFTKCKVQELKKNMAYSLRHVSLDITTHLSLDIKILFYREA